MARLPERDEAEEKHLRLQLSECFKKKLVIAEHQAGQWWTAKIFGSEHRHVLAGSSLSPHYFEPSPMSQFFFGDMKVILTCIN